MRGIKVIFSFFVCLTVAQADGIKMGGNVEAGWQLGTQSGAAAGKAKGSYFMVDAAHMHWSAELSDSTTVVLNKALSLVSGGANAAFTPFNSNAFLSGFLIASGAGSDGTFTLHAQEAYLEHEFTDGISMQAGLMRTPFGIESLWERFDMHSYYYSFAYSIAQAIGWYYDLGLGFRFDGMFPGVLEFSIVDGRTNNATAAGTTPVGVLGAAADNTTPGLAARYHYKMELDSMNLTPVISTYLTRWSGGPKDVGITAGLQWDMGMIWANAEFLIVNNQVNPNISTDKNKATSLVLEPGVNFGDMSVSAKLDFHGFQARTAGAKTNDINLGVAVSKRYGDDYRIRLTFLDTNLSKKLAGRTTTDIRLLFGASW